MGILLVKVCFGLFPERIDVPIGRRQPRRKLLPNSPPPREYAAHDPSLDAGHALVYMHSPPIRARRCSSGSNVADRELQGNSPLAPVTQGSMHALSGDHADWPPSQALASAKGELPCDFACAEYEIPCAAAFFRERRTASSAWAGPSSASTLLARRPSQGFTVLSSCNLFVALCYAEAEL